MSGVVMHLRRRSAAQALCGYAGKTFIEWYPGTSAPPVSCAECTANAHPEEWKPAVKLVGEDGNAFAILAACRRAARKAGWSDEKWAVVRDDMTSGDYNTLLAAAMEHFDVR